MSKKLEADRAASVIDFPRIFQGSFPIWQQLCSIAVSCKLSQRYDCLSFHMQRITKPMLVVTRMAHDVFHGHLTMGPFLPNVASWMNLTKIKKQNDQFVILYEAELGIKPESFRALSLMLRVLPPSPVCYQATT